jgi:FkbM family methyltransferase
MNQPIARRCFASVPPESDLVILDCGARYGGEKARWANASNSLVVYGFEPDEAECARLNSMLPTSDRSKYYPICLGEESETTREFFVTQQRHSSSLYCPATTRLARWKQGGPTQFVRTQDVLKPVLTNEVTTTSLDDWAKAEKIKDIDFLKIDVQGAELDVLKGGREILKTSVALEVEVEFSGIYENQPLFADVDCFLSDNGFTFFNFSFTHTGHFAGRLDSPINVVHPQNHLFPPQIAGQLITADAIYLRDPIEHGGHSADWNNELKILKLAGVAEVLGQAEFAFELLQHLRQAGSETAKTVYEAAARDYQNMIASPQNR